MKKCFLLLTLSLFTFSCTIPNQQNTNFESDISISANKLGEIGVSKNLPFSVKGTVFNENTSGFINYSGNWTTITDSNARGGNYSISLTEDNSTNLTYNSSWSTNNNSSASNGTYTSPNSNSYTIEENNSSNIKYTGLKWMSAGSTYDYVYSDKGILQTIENSNPSVTYSGATWQTITYGDGNTDTYAYSCSDPVGTCPNYYEFNFTGDNIQLIGRRGPIWGKVKVSVYDMSDNLEKMVDNIDLYNPNYLVNQNIVQIFGLSDQTHRIRVEATGTKNASSSDYVYDFDKAYIVYGAIELENDSGLVTYNGDFYHLATTYGFSAHYAYGCTDPVNTCPTSAEFEFEGTNVHVLGRKGPEWGMVNVSIYAETSPGSGIFSSTPIQTVTNVDMYDPTYLANQTLAKFSALKSQKYKVRIEPSGTKNAASSSYIYDFDKAIIYPSIEYEFTGSDIIYKALKNNYCGKVDVSLDGANTERVNLYSPSGVYEQVKHYSQLGSGSHRLTIEGTNDKDPSSTNYIMTMDKLEGFANISGSFKGTDAKFRIVKDQNYGIMDLYIDGILNQTIDAYNPSFIFHEFSASGLTDANHTFSLKMNGNKNASSTGYSQGLDYVMGIPSKATYIFTGSDIEYYATKSNNMGEVEVYLDGVLQGTYDLYSSTTQNKQLIASYTGLTHKSHTIELIAKQTKNVSSIGYGISLDYFYIVTPEFDGGIGAD